MRREVEAAVRVGVSPRRFWGWEPTTRTTYVRDGEGRVASSVTTVEPEWDAESRAYLLALLAYEADQCPGCKGLLSETTRADMEGRYHALPAMRCQRCTAIAIKSTVEYKDAPHPHALFYPIENLGPPPRDDDEGVA